MILGCSQKYFLDQLGLRIRDGTDAHVGTNAHSKGQGVNEEGLNKHGLKE
jgi:hypothetical protein